MKAKPSMMLWLSDARGQYIPRDFAKSFVDREKSVSGVSADDWTRLEDGPDAAWHWETWEDVLNNAVVTDENGVKFRLYQDGDLWLVPEGMEWSDETHTFEWPLENEENEDGGKIESSISFVSTPLKHPDGSPLVAGEIKAGDIVTFDLTSGTVIEISQLKPMGKDEGNDG